MSQPKPLRFENVSYVSVGSKILGHVSFSQEHITWRSFSSDTRHRIDSSSVRVAQFIPLRHGFRLKLIADDDNILVLDGFEEKDKLALREFLNGYGVNLDCPTWSTKGETWGRISLETDCIPFDLDSGRAFELSFNSISNASNPHKTEVELDFHQDDVGAEAGDDFLCQIKFHVPEGWEGEAASDIVTTVKEHTKVSVSLSDVVADFSGIAFVTPRGKYDISLFSNYIRLTGKTHSYKVLCDSVSRLFLLPRPDQKAVFFVISLDRPIRQGATSYPHLVATIPPDAEVFLELKLSEEECRDRYQNRLQPHMEGLMSKVIARVFRCITGTKVTIPNQNGFKSYEDEPCVKVAFKQNEGFLYPLERSFIYLHKPPILYRYDSIKYIEFSRVQGQRDSRTFDMEIIPRSGEKIMFSQINKEEYDRLSKFFKDKGIRTRNVVEEGTEHRIMEILSEPEMEEEEEDVEFNALESASESEVESELEEELAEIVPAEQLDESVIIESGRKRRTNI
ncbi:hypothetical protein GEMRC1_003777 [Eukaryota sp. GEM-RC1]